MDSAKTIMHPILAKDLSVSYGTHSILSGIDFEAKGGEFVSVVGKSGSGKTTLLHALAGLIPFSGEIKESKAIDLIFQNNAVYPWMTVEENITFSLESESSSKQKQVVTEHLALADLLEKRMNYPAELSGGQVQRVALARALAHRPDVLLMDEPYGALDAYTRDKMQQWLLDVWETHKKTIVFVTHNIEEAIFLSDRVLVLRDGKFVKELTVPFPRSRLPEIKFSVEFNRMKEEIYNAL